MNYTQVEWSALLFLSVQTWRWPWPTGTWFCQEDLSSLIFGTDSFWWVKIRDVPIKYVVLVSAPVLTFYKAHQVIHNSTSHGRLFYCQSNLWLHGINKNHNSEFCSVRSTVFKFGKEERASEQYLVSPATMSWGIGIEIGWEKVVLMHPSVKFIWSGDGELGDADFHYTSLISTNSFS